MYNNIKAQSKTEIEQKTLSATLKKHIIVFSPDADLARFLLMDIEDVFEIMRVHTLRDFELAFRQLHADLVVIDLFAFSDDIIKQIEVIRRFALSTPVIILRAYKSLSPEANTAIESITHQVFFKPVDVELITQTVQDILK